MDTAAQHMTPEQLKKSTPSTETMNELIAVYLDRLSKAECQGDDQRTAAVVLGEAIRRAQNTAKAAQETARVLAMGISEEMKG